MIVDGRRTSQLFNPPPGVELITGEGLSGIELGEDLVDENWGPEESAAFSKQFQSAMGVADVSDFSTDADWMGSFAIISVGRG